MAEYLQLKPDLGVQNLSRLLSAFHSDAIWKWNLLVQDAITFPAESKFVRELSSFNSGKSILDVSWGHGYPIVSHCHDFSMDVTEEMGLSLNYLFQGNSKAKQILRDINHHIGAKKFDRIRLYLVAQHVRQHGVLLEGLSSFLNVRGQILVVDVRDQLLDFNPPVSNLRNMYEKLWELQKLSGGLRSAAERIQKRASNFGYGLMESEIWPVQSQSEETRLNFFRMFCLHTEILTRSFVGKFDRSSILQDIFNWWAADKSWAKIGLHFVVLEKKRLYGKKRLPKP